MFTDRTEAGKELAERLGSYRGKNAVALALPRGGVVIGYEVAKALKLPLDIIAVRKIGHPHSPEYAVGAVDENKHIVLNEVEALDFDQRWLKKEVDAQRKEAKRRGKTYRSGRSPAPLKGKIAIIVDDGIATGFTVRVAIRAAKSRGAGEITVAAPVASAESLEAIRQEGVDDVVTLEKPEQFAGAIGAHYVQFDQLTDEEVIRLLWLAGSDHT
jgi:putative phosphoribosyl transferase